MSWGKEVAFVCHPYHRGGVTRWMVDMAIDFSKNNVQVYFVTIEPKKEFFSSGGRETILSMLQGYSNIKIIKKTAGWSYEFGTGEYKAGIYAKLLKQYVPAGIPVILSDDKAVWETAISFKNYFHFIGVLHSDDGVYYEFAETYKGHIDCFVCVSNRIKNKLKSFYHIESRIATIPCGIPLPAFEFEDSPPEKISSLVYVGRVSEYQKRVSDLIDISIALQKKNVAFHLKIIGDGEDKATLERKVADNSLQEHISFLGWQSKENIDIYLKQSDVLLLTSNFEGMPIAVMEALSLGCGVCSTRVSGIEDYENHPKAAHCLWINSIGETNEAVNNIITCLSTPMDLRTRSARLLAISEFGIDICREKYIDLFNSILINKCDKLLKLNTINFKFNNVYSYLLAFIRYVKMKIISLIC